MPDDVNQAAVDRLVARARDALPGTAVRSAFSGTRGLSPTMVAVVAAVPATVVVVVALVAGRPALLVLAAVVLVGTLAVVMTRVNATRVVAELPRELVVLGARRGELHEMSRAPRSLSAEPVGRSWLRVTVAGEQLWVSRVAFGGIVARFTDAEPPGASPPDVR